MKWILIAMALLVSGCTESCQRQMKTTQSEWMGGLKRKCVVYAFDGTVLRTYEGRYDIEDVEGLLSFDLDGKRHLIWNGGTTICDEL